MGLKGILARHGAPLFQAPSSCHYRPHERYQGRSHQEDEASADGSVSSVGRSESTLETEALSPSRRRYTSRAILPPSFATVLSLLPHAKIPSLPSGQHPSIPHRQIYTTFPLPHLSGALGVHIVEPDYVHQALRVLAGGSVLGRGEKRTDEEWKKGSWEERAERMRQLGDVVNIGELARSWNAVGSGPR